jgi:Ca2+-binding RTX toxin-like protein
MATIYGTKNSDTINVYDGVTNDADIIFGRDGDDTIMGLGGDDILKGGGGADKLWGYSGSDWADYSDSTAGVKVNLTSGKASGGTAEGDTFVSIENVSGSAYDDTISGDNKVNQLHGGDGSDVLAGRAGGDRLDGGAGLDYANYAHSAEAVSVNLFNGSVSGGDAAGDTFVSIEGLLGSDFDDHLYGNDERNIIVGNGGDDTLKGYGGDDWLQGDAGADLMLGGAGDDCYDVQDPTDQVHEWGDSGMDWVFSSVSYALPDNVELLHLRDEGGAINATGNGLNNSIAGNDHANVINGLGGTDSLQGNGGADTFTWSSVGHTGVTEWKSDKVLDFSFAEGDRLDLSDIDADVYAPGDQAFTFIGTAAFTLNAATPENTDVVPGEIRYYHADGNTYIEMQTGQSADVEGVIMLSGIVTPQASWFIL